MELQQMEQTAVKSVTDVAAVGTVTGSLVGWLPELATLFTILWLGIRMWESETVKGLRARFRRKPEQVPDCPHGYENWDDCPD